MRRTAWKSLLRKPPYQRLFMNFTASLDVFLQKRVEWSKHKKNCWKKWRVVRNWNFLGGRYIHISVFYAWDKIMFARQVKPKEWSSVQRGIPATAALIQDEVLKLSNPFGVTLQNRYCNRFCGTVQNGMMEDMSGHLCRFPGRMRGSRLWWAHY